MDIPISDPALAAVHKMIRETMNEMADNLATGSVASFEEYKLTVGKIHGLALAERYLLDVSAKTQKDDELV